MQPIPGEDGGEHGQKRHAGEQGPSSRAPGLRGSERVALLASVSPHMPHQVGFRAEKWGNRSPEHHFQDFLSWAPLMTSLLSPGSLRLPLPREG